MEATMIYVSTTTNKLTTPKVVPADALGDIDVLARQIDQFGFEYTSDDAIDHVLTISRITDGSPVLAEVFADSTEPPAVRERAFGLLAMQIRSSINRKRLTPAA
jgi:hypothetical protein